MPLKWFTYPMAETRFFHAGRSVYKFKMRYSSHIREGLGVDRNQIQMELELAIRAVLGNLDTMQPFATKHFTIFPYKSEWERLSKLRFKLGDKTLISYPYVCMLYVELRSPDHNYFSPALMKEPVGRPTAKGGGTTGADETRKRKGEEASHQPRKRNKQRFLKSDKEKTSSAHMNMTTGDRGGERHLQSKNTQRTHTLSGKPTDTTQAWREVGVKDQVISQQVSEPNSPEATGGFLRFFSSAFPFRLIFGSRRPL